ncbi:MAG: class I SAM-dependent methyltransferase [Magnetovibrio sp.]|nr:class I SAM-dependent methyltransferase [Magnetovibrio sp.]
MLDLGCGPGGLTQDMALKGWQMTGVDRAPKMIKRA